MRNVYVKKYLTEDVVQLKIPEPIFDIYGKQVNDYDYDVGVKIIGVHVSKVSKKWFVVEYYSNWLNEKGICRGQYFIAYDMTKKYDIEEIVRLCEHLDIDIPEQIEL
jgi:hypothetical protein